MPPAADDAAFVHEQAQGADVRRLEVEVVMHIAEHGEEAVVERLQPRPVVVGVQQDLTRELVEPALAVQPVPRPGGGEVEMQPQHAAAALLRRVDLLEGHRYRRRVGGEEIAADQVGPGIELDWTCHTRRTFRCLFSGGVPDGGQDTPANVRRNLVLGRLGQLQQDRLQTVITLSRVCGINARASPVE